LKGEDEEVGRRREKESWSELKGGRGGGNGHGDAPAMGKVKGR
jgi:hypothetical protein